MFSSHWMIYFCFVKINSATFVISNTDIQKCPQDGLPEFAFIGRSNVGKSSLLNMLTGVKNLAKTSGTPGKTQLINHFLINENWYLVDLPGYGYAKASKKMRGKWEKFIANYLTQRVPLMNLFVLIDCRHKPQSIDLEFLIWCAEKELPFSIVFTKTDKLSKGALASNLAIYKKTILTYWETLPPMFHTSSESGQGKDSVIRYISEILQENHG